VNEGIGIIFAGIVGLLLGGFFFGGLLWTVRKGVSSSSPVLLFAGSFVIRTVIVLAGFYFVSNEDWKRIVSCLIGFIISKIIIKWFYKSPLEKQTQLKKDSDNAHNS